MGRTWIDGSHLILLLIGVCLGMTLVATIVLWPTWSPVMRALVVLSDVFWIVGASRLVVCRDPDDSAAVLSGAEAVDADA